jgi:hypothetical protein
MKHKLTTTLFILFITLVLSLAGCGGNAGEKEEPSHASQFYKLTGSPFWAVDSDLNGDGLKDVAVIVKYSGLFVYFNTGESLSPDPVRFNFMPHGTSIDTGDFNGDSIPDLAYIVENSVQILINDGTGRAFNSALILDGPLFSLSLRTPDLNNDGISDIVAVGAEDSQVYIHLSSGPLKYTLTKLDMPQGAQYFKFSAKTLSVADINNDGFLDIFVPEFRNNSLWVIWNKGKEGFMPERILTLPPDDKIIQALPVKYDKETNTSFIAVISGTYAPAISIYSLSNSTIKLVGTKTLPHPNPTHIFTTGKKNHTDEFIVTHSHDMKSLNGAISRLRLDPVTLAISNMEVVETLPSKGVMSLYLDNLHKTLTVCIHPDGLSLIEAK